MVDVTDKDVTGRVAVARGRICMRPETLALIVEKKVSKGDVFSVARVAGMMAAKRTPSVELSLTLEKNPARVEIEAVVKVTGQTGVEMEAMTAVAVCGLTIYDMCKAADREMTLGEIRLVKKSGGKSGAFTRKK
jgi:cyclic pyranopterin phosphate synthase